MAERYFPKQFDLGWIFYNDANKSLINENGYWEQVRKKGVDDAKNILAKVEDSFSMIQLRAKMEKYSETLLNMSKVERNREQMLMQEILGEDYSERAGLEFIKHFNEILIGGERFSANLKRVIAAIDKGGKERAPSMATNFVSSFMANFNKELEPYMKNLDLILSEWDQIVERVIIRTIEKITVDFVPEEGKEHFGTPEDYERLDTYLKENTEFYNFVRQYMRIDSIKQEVIDIITGEKQKRRKHRVEINDVFKVKNKEGKLVQSETLERAIGGLVYEFFSAGSMQIKLGESSSNVISNSVSSNKGATDTITLFSSDLHIDVGKIYERLQNTMDGETQQKIAYRLKDLDRKLDRKKYKNLFIIHGSDKLYSMGDSFRAFSKDQKITDIQYLLKQTELGPERFERELVSLYLNTTEGAVLDDKTEQIENKLRIIVAAVAGSMLFSDWFMIGYEAGGPSQIHIFDLDGIILPLSYVLEGMSKAMKEFGETGIYTGPITIGSFTRGKILYPAKEKNRYEGLTQGELNNFSQVWKRQREDAQSKAHFRIQFMSNFKTIVRDLAKMTNF